MLSKKFNIRILNIVALVLVLALIVVSVTLSNVKVETKALRARSLDTSIVRLHDAESGKFFCSGVIISQTRLLTAAHCVVRQSFFGIMKVDRVEIRTQDNKAIGLYAVVESANPRQDLAILSGDFNGMDRRLVITNSNNINDILLNKNSSIVTCGFPNAGPLRCSKLVLIDRTLFFFSARGFVYPGMSGGPVMDAKTGAVLAVNQAVMEDGRVVISPLIELFDNLGLDESPNKQ